MSAAILEVILITTIRESQTNPKARTVGPVFDELVESVKVHGVLTPVLVRPRGDVYELVAGHRRVAAARAAGLTAVPANIREMTDNEALELQLIENLQRAELHPLEEAHGYNQLSRQPGYDVAKIAARVGRSPAYVYDRLKLLQLTKPAQELFRGDRFTAAHAVLLARLKPAEQERALNDHEALFEDERLLFDDQSDARFRNGRRDDGPKKPRSVRQFSQWIDRNVRFDAKATDPMLFPETVVALEGAGKVVAITHENYVPPEARDGKTFGPRSWKRADGSPKNKSCDHAVMGFVAAGRDRGAAFKVCVNKDKCRVHWPAQARAQVEKRADGQKLVGNMPASSKKAPVPAQQDSPALVKAIAEARDAAAYMAIARALELVGEMSALEFLRALARAREWETRDYLQTLKVRDTSRAGIERWTKQAQLPDLQRALLPADDDNVIAVITGINPVQAKRDAEKRVRADFAAKKHADDPKPAKKKAAKKRGAR